MITKSVYDRDVRVRREAQTLVSDGHELTVIGLDSSRDVIDGVRVLGVGDEADGSGRAEGRPPLWYRLGRWLLLPEHRNRAVRQFQEAAREAALQLATPPDVIHAHDFPALEPAVELAGRYSSRLIYDSHEYWAGLPRRGRPEPFRRRSNQARERELARDADAVIMVSEMGAQLLADRLDLGEVVVIRNTFPTRTDLSPPSEPVGAVYAGRIAPGRDLETVIRSSVWHDRPRFALHFIGEVDDFSVPEFVTAHPMGNMNKVDRLLVENGLALVTMSRGPINHQIALPNKLLKAVSVGVPVIAADLPQTAALVEEHHLGALYIPGDPSSLAAAVENVIENYVDYVSHVRRAQPIFDWSVDAARLLEVYERVRHAQGY